MKYNFCTKILFLLLLFYSFDSLERLDTYANENVSFTSFSDTCDYVDLVDSKDISIGTRDLCVMQLNIRGLLSKQQDLHQLLKSVTQLERVDVLILVETWLTKESESRVCIPGYTYYGHHCTTKKGGIGFLIRNELNFVKRHDLHDASTCFENCFIELKSLNKNIILCSLYRPPNQNTKSFIQYINVLLSNLAKERSKDVIIGLDHNLDLLKHHIHENTQTFMETIVDNSLMLTIVRPTRITRSSATLIDNILMSMNIYVKQMSCVLLSDISDHFPYLSIIRNCLPDRSNQLTTVKRKITEKTINQIKEKLSIVNWSNILPCADVNSSTEIFHTK